MPKSLKQKIKVTNQTIRLRFEAAKTDKDFIREYGRQFSFRDAAKLFGISRQHFWYWHSNNPKYMAIPPKNKCPKCGFSMYEKVSAWINDGCLDHLLPRDPTPELHPEPLKQGEVQK